MRDLYADSTEVETIKFLSKINNSEKIRMKEKSNRHHRVMFHSRRYNISATKKFKFRKKVSIKRVSLVPSLFGRDFFLKFGWFIGEID